MQKFYTGDVVEYVGKSGVWKWGETHIIHDCEYEGQGTFKYSTNRGAWFEDNDFVLIRKADAESFKQLDEALFDEDAV